MSICTCPSEWSSARAPASSSPITNLELIAGTPVEVGTLLGTVGGCEVRSPFAGRLEGALARAGERVQTGQPIVWLHAS